MNELTITICIGDFVAQIEYPSELKLPDNFYLFECCDKNPEYQYKIHLTDRLPDVSGRVIARRDDLVVVQNEQTGPSDENVKGENRENDSRKENASGFETTGLNSLCPESAGLEARIIGVHGLNRPYAIYRETSEKTAEIYYLRELLNETSIDTIFTSLLALERRMIRKNALILHCAYISYQGEAILFSAPSETGKSTQADLWEKYRGSRTINGDKALLQKVDGRWIARGWPICGSSEICNNEDTPIKAIVVLSQSPDNHSGFLRPAAAFQKLYSQITVNSWNTDSVSRAMDLIGSLQEEVPVYYLECNISEDAVATLENTIYSK